MMNQETKERIDRIEDTFAILNDSNRKNFIEQMHDELIFLHEHLSENIQLELFKFHESNLSKFASDNEDTSWYQLQPNGLSPADHVITEIADELDRLAEEAMTKLRNFANATEVMDKDPSLLDELENYMNTEEKNALTLLERQAEESVTFCDSTGALVIGEEDVRRIGKDGESLYDKVLERLKVENKSKEEK